MLHMPMFEWRDRESELRREQKGESCRIHGYFDVNRRPDSLGRLDTPEISKGHLAMMVATFMCSPSFDPMFGKDMKKPLAFSCFASFGLLIVG